MSECKPLGGGSLSRSTCGGQPYSPPATCALLGGGSGALSRSCASGAAHTSLAAQTTVG